MGKEREAKERYEGKDGLERWTGSQLDGQRGRVLAACVGRYLPKRGGSLCAAQPSWVIVTAFGSGGRYV